MILLLADARAIHKKEGYINLQAVQPEVGMVQTRCGVSR